MRDDGLTLALAEVDPLPRVSVLTITRNRRRRFALAVNNSRRFDYPADKLEWVIVDDSDEGCDARPSLGALRRDPRVRFVRATTFDGKPLPIGKKRQLACEHATGDVYLPHGRRRLRARTRGVGPREEPPHLCRPLRRVDDHPVLRRTFAELFAWMSADVFGDLNVMPEAGLAYERSSGKSAGGTSGPRSRSGRNSPEGDSMVVSIPSQFLIIAITHVGHCTGDLRRSHRVHAFMRMSADAGRYFRTSSSDCWEMV